ncbi:MULTISPECIES: alpha/beta hydrolase [unclassified Dietzia]|uniref:alpha/beta hydrolase n=1 Tax=unclassified Dietzia TaxID=2617939 RepID=UPI000D20981E|nr:MULTISPECIES: alpha/beta fold hydrolase [unclassified Dietzia]AVZ38168.1 alpha/beta hydrolase [Dietzia sp. JS16-p6b]QGW23138.1 alpha/beta hydrolase fold protein [Dietzia sp. DQ12-45-1b]
MTSQITPHDLEFRSGGDTCRGWFLPAAGTDPAPCVVLAHGLGGTADSGLLPFAEAFAAAGFAAFAFDYRGFGRSGGGPRQVVSTTRQQDDIRAAVSAVAARPDVDADRVVLWGCSLAGGHALEVAREPGGATGIAAVIAVVPLVDGRAAAVAAARQHRPVALLRSTGTTVAAKAAAALGRSEPLVPLVGPPGSTAVLSLDGYDKAYRSLAGPSWRNEIGGGVGAVLGSFRPGARAAELAGTPVLFQIADLDRSAPPHAASSAAFAARAEVRHYPGDHFDLFPGRPCHDLAVSHALHFLRRRMG